MKRMIVASTQSLGPYDEWYSEISESKAEALGYAVKDEHTYISDALDDYEIKFLGYAIADADKISEEALDALISEGYDLLVVGARYDNNELGLFYVFSGHTVLDVSPEEIERILDSTDEE